METPRFAVNSFVVDGPNPIPQRETQRLLAPYVSDQADLTSLQQAADALEDALRRRGYGFIQVSLPQQSLRDGVVHLKVVPFTLGKVGISGNEHFSPDNIRRSLPVLTPGQTPNTRHISRNLGVANAHPAKNLRVTFAASETPQQIDAQVSVSDRRAQQFYSWVNNTGSAETGETRLGLGYQHSNLFGRDHALTLTYTTSPDHADEIAQYGAQYQIPFYRWGGLLNVFFAYSDVATGTVAEFFDVSGKGTVAGLRYSQLLPAIGAYSQRVELGVTDKLFDNEVDFLGEPLGVDVRSRPLSLRYAANWEGQRTRVGFYAGVNGNLDGGSDNTDAAYAASRSGADANWSTIHYGANAQATVKGWLLTGQLLGQYTNDPLIAGEQFGAGGVGSVRGFRERELTGDRGYSANLEAWSPQLGKTGLRALAFVDAAHTELVEALPGEIESENVASAGVGLHWSWRRNLVARLDWGYVLNGADQSADGATDDTDSKLHFNLSYRF